MTMKTNETLFNIFQDDERVKGYMLEVLRKSFNDYKQSEDNFKEAVDQLKTSNGSEENILFDELINAKYQQILSDIKFEIILGVKSNLDYFKSVDKADFLDSDIDVYIKEESMRLLPGRKEVQKRV